MNTTKSQKQFYRKILISTLLGISSGMPLFVLYQTIPAWLRDSGINLSDIGLFQLIGIPYTIKFLWAPFLERFNLPFLGLRRGWMITMQVALILSIALIGLFNPTQHITIIVILTLIMTTFSATQDIVIDAYRRELLNDDELGAGNAWFVNAYRFSSLVPGSLAFILSDIIDWQYVFPIIAAFMLIGVATTLLIKEYQHLGKQPTSFIDTIKEPLTDYFSRFSLKQGVLLLLFLMLYKLGDQWQQPFQLRFIKI